MENKFLPIVKLLFSLSIIILFTINNAFAQTSGKISGQIIDKESGDPLIAVNVVLSNGTDTFGAATDLNGNYNILNIRPGLFTLKTSMIGYSQLIVNNVNVSVNRTTTINMEMEQSTIQGQTVIVEATKVSKRKDITSTVKNVSAESMKNLPIEDVASVVAMQTGVVQGHFRGGRAGEVSYMIDGVRVNEGFSNERAVTVNPEAVQDLEVITGTFNAEYGKAMSGIVNAVTKSGGNSFNGQISFGTGNYFTGNDDIFIGLEESDLLRNKNLKMSFSGPIIKDKLFFFTNYRYTNYNNHLNGVRRFNIDDYYIYDEAAHYFDSWNTGDSDYVAMNKQLNQSFLGKLTYKLTSKVRLSMLYSSNNDEYHSYNHVYKYNPDGRSVYEHKNNMYTLSLNHMLSTKMFYDLKYNHMEDYAGNYVYENPLDDRYIHDKYLTGSELTGFYTGGQSKNHLRREQIQDKLKLDLTYQINNYNQIKTGFIYTKHNITNKNCSILNKYRTNDALANADSVIIENGELKQVFLNYEPEIMGDESIYSDIYTVKPIEFSAYIQDKFEYKDMVINFGMRYDQFDPNTTYESNWRNPNNRRDVEIDSMRSEDLEADVKTQLSPRLGLSYELGNNAILHFSYGYFLQMPEMSAIYNQHSHVIPSGKSSYILGNPQIKSQKTTSYEIGLWQQLSGNMDLDITLFYKDIYNLLSSKLITTYDQAQYGLYTNLDYGNVRGIEFKYGFFMKNLNFDVNYTLQYTRGNSSDPTQAFNRAGQKLDPMKKMIPLNWDQRHTLNISMGYNAENYGGTITGYYNSGTPYTWSPQADSRLIKLESDLFNKSWSPTTYSVDLKAYYNVNITKNYRIKFTCQVYNLFDKLNANWVDGTTGKPYTSRIAEEQLNSHHSDFNDYKDRIQNPSMYSAPREIKLEAGLYF